VWDLLSCTVTWSIQLVGTALAVHPQLSAFAVTTKAGVYVLDGTHDGQFVVGDDDDTSQLPVSRPFPSWNRSILTEISLCHACSCQEILRVETAGQEDKCFTVESAPAGLILAHVSAASISAIFHAGTCAVPLAVRVCLALTASDNCGALQSGEADDIAQIGFDPVATEQFVADKAAKVPPLLMMDRSTLRFMTLPPPAAATPSPASTPSPDPRSLNARPKGALEQIVGNLDTRIQPELLDDATET
jgi:hypothetical protein